MIVKAPFAEHVSFATVPGQYPGSLMGTISALRQMLLGKLAPALRSIGLLTPKVRAALRADDAAHDPASATDGAWLPKEFLGSLRPFLALRRAARRAAKDPSLRG